MLQRIKIELEGFQEVVHVEDYISLLRNLGCVEREGYGVGMKALSSLV